MLPVPQTILSGLWVQWAKLGPAMVLSNLVGARATSSTLPPGGSSDEPDSTVRNGEGIIVLDAKANYAFVKRIPLQDLPASLTPEEVSAMMSDPVTNMAYISTA